MGVKDDLKQINIITFNNSIYSDLPPLKSPCLICAQIFVELSPLKLTIRRVLFKQLTQTFAVHNRRPDLSLSLKSRTYKEFLVECSGRTYEIEDSLCVS